MFQGVLDEFRAEVSALACLNHPHIIQMYGISVHRNSIYLVVELCPNNLQEFLDADGSDPQQPRAARSQSLGKRTPIRLNHIQGMAVARQVASALQFIHFKKMAHRDIKVKWSSCAPTCRTFVNDFGPTFILVPMCRTSCASR
jgi:serine/threonine protein kinase